MELTKHHSVDISESTFLITGGAGFIGSNLVHYLLHYKAGKVKVLDNFSTGFRQNIEPFLEAPNFEFIEGDISIYEDCLEACHEVDYVLHQAALGSVPRSIETPLATNQSNVVGFLNLITAARESGVRRTVYASSSSVYGDDERLPKLENQTGNPLSPYAVSKLTNELYANVAYRNYGQELIGLRYFNVFGPNQSPKGAYAAVIPLFIEALLNNQSPYINGDGKQSRDFTYVDNAVQANIRALFTESEEALGQVFNVALGEQTSLLGLYDIIRQEIGTDKDAIHREERPGDIKDSLADISKTKRFLGYEPQVRFEEGIKKTIEWFLAKDVKKN